MKRCLITDHYRNDSLDHIHFHAIRKDVESGTPRHRWWDLKRALCKVLGCPTGSYTAAECARRSIFLIYGKNENICQQKPNSIVTVASKQRQPKCLQVMNENQNVVCMKAHSTTGHSVSITTTIKIQNLQQFEEKKSEELLLMRSGIL